MEDVLDVYTRPYDPKRPQVCLDETSRQLLADAKAPEPMAPGYRPAVREDYEYVRSGVCNVFMVCEPLAGWRHVVLSERRTRIDFAHCIKELVEVHYPEAEKIVLVMDNLRAPIPRRPSTRRSRRRRPSGCRIVWRSTTRPSTAVG
jgi:hypothetical protein